MLDANRAIHVGDQKEYVEQEVYQIIVVPEVVEVFSQEPTWAFDELAYLNPNLIGHKDCNEAHHWEVNA